jgi:hypothetical protein
MLERLHLTSLSKDDVPQCLRDFILPLFPRMMFPNACETSSYFFFQICLQFEAIESFLTEALKQGDKQHIEELKVKLDAAEAEVETGKVMIR